MAGPAQSPPQHSEGRPLPLPHLLERIRVRLTACTCACSFAALHPAARPLHGAAVPSGPCKPWGTLQRGTGTRRARACTPVCGTMCAQPCRGAVRSLRAFPHGSTVRVTGPCRARAHGGERAACAHAKVGRCSTRVRCGRFKRHLGECVRPAGSCGLEAPASPPPSGSPAGPIGPGCLLPITAATWLPLSSRGERGGAGSRGRTCEKRGAASGGEGTPAPCPALGRGRGVPSSPHAAGCPKACRGLAASTWQSQSRARGASRVHSGVG